MVCTHERSLESGRAYCTRAAGGELRGWLKDRIRADGLRGELLAVTTGCQGVCPAQGVTVGLVGATGDAEMMIVDPVKDRQQLWDRLIELSHVEED